MKTLHEWMKKNETGDTVKKTIEYDLPNGEKEEVELEIQILSGIDKDFLESELYSEDGSIGITKYKRSLVMRSLGISQKDFDDLNRNKSSYVMELIEDACLSVNRSKFFVSREDIEKLKNLHIGEQSQTD